MVPVRIALLGYGHHTRGQIKAALLADPAFEIAVVYNRGEARRKEAEADGFETTDVLDTVMNDSSIDAVFVGTGNEIHREHCLAAARAGKHILCEKPLSLTVADVEVMCEAVSRAGVVAHVNHGMPFNETFSHLRKLVAQECGEVLHFWMRASRGFGNWKQGARHYAVENPELSGGWTVHHLCHSLDAAMMILPGKVRQVYHVMQKSCAECPSEELTQSILTLDSGVTAYLADGTTLGGFHDIGVIGTEADIRVVDGKITVVRSGGAAKAGRAGMLERVITEYPCRGKVQGKVTEAVFRQFARSIRGEPANPVTFEFVREQYRILDALKASASQGQVVSV